MNIKNILKPLQILLFALPFATLANDENTGISTEQEKYIAWANQLWSSIERQTGTINLTDAAATLNITDDFYYLSSADAEKVLVEVWGNPPGQDTLGMIMPVNLTPFDPESWAVTIQYEEDGYVSDEDADDIDYTELLTQMKEDTQAASQQRLNEGYPAIKLLGWASPPYYDKTTHKLHWAKELKVGENEQNTLNYNIRILGRKGVLVLNFIAGIDQQTVIEEKLNSVLAMAEFEQGSHYSDFNPDIDDVAAYGLGALVAGKVIAKTGLIAVAIVFLKKFGVFLLIGLGMFFKRFFKRKTTTPAES